MKRLWNNEYLSNNIHIKTKRCNDIKFKSTTLTQTDVLGDWLEKASVCLPYAFLSFSLVNKEVCFKMEVVNVIQQKINHTGFFFRSNKIINRK